MKFKQSNSLTFYLTEKCNFDCVYCYNKKDFLSSLNYKQVKKGLIFFLNQIVYKKDYVFITIMGGEPFMEKRILYDLISILRKEEIERGLKIIIHLFTNGSFLSKKNVEWLQNNNVRIYVSLDGVKEANDINRRFRGSDKSVFDTVIGKLRKLTPEQRSKIGINMVMGPENCKYLMRSVKLFHDMGFYSIDTSILSYYIWPKEAITKLRKNLEKFIQYYKRLFFKFSKKEPFRMYQLDYAQKGEWDNMDKCDRIKLGPNGLFYFCDAFFSTDIESRKKFAIGDVEKGFSLEKLHNLKEKAKANLKDKFPSKFIQHKCNKRVYCPYGVYYYSKITGTNMLELLKRFYESSEIYSKMLFKLYNSLKDNEKFRDFYDKEPVGASSPDPQRWEMQ